MKKLNLCGTWEMTGEDGRSFPSEVPGSVLDTLLEHGEIPDPFDGMNEFTACAETRRRWCFARSFRMTEEDLRYGQADLVFDGLDTLAAVELNGQTVARTDNMHRTWRIPVKEALRHGENRLRVFFEPALDWVEKAARENPDVSYDGGSELKGTGFLRKAHYMFGWDWGPRLPDAGIWRPCRIEFYDSRLEDVRIRQVHGENRVDLVSGRQPAQNGSALELPDPDGQVSPRPRGQAGETIRLRSWNTRGCGGRTAWAASRCTP